MDAIEDDCVALCPTVLGGTPAFFQAFERSYAADERRLGTQAARSKWKTRLGNRLRLVVLGGSAVGDSIKKFVREILGVNVIDGCKQIETILCCLCLFVDNKQKSKRFCVVCVCLSITKRNRNNFQILLSRMQTMATIDGSSEVGGLASNSEQSSSVKLQLIDVPHLGWKASEGDYCLCLRL